ncbi:MAG: fatty acid desaturase [Myxococcales bacterium]|nr:fatty acid desaturase [Myxococcales bacterium]
MSTTTNPQAPTRTEKELIAASRPYASESKAQSWTAVLVTLVVLVGFWSGAALAPHWALRLVFGILAGLTIVRMFILYHDYMHGAILRGSALAKALFYVYGVVVMTPPRVWRDTHNYHHANTAKIIGSHVGSYMMVTTGMWAKMSSRERFMYKAVRHPLTILFGYFTVFMLGMCVSPFVRAPKKNWDSAVSLLLNWTVTALVVWKLGVLAFVLGYFVPLAVAMASGAYLFYAQHNFPEMNVQPRHEWTYARAALESSSYMKMGPVMNWFTGNIGYHHVHHLNQQIPFYRLPEAMGSIPELQNPPTTTLRLSDVVACFKLKLWDPDSGKMVGYPEA